MTWNFDRDFIKVPRKIIELLATKPVTLQVFLLILSRVRWEEGPSIRARDLEHLQPGQAVIGQEELATIASASRSTIRTALKDLQIARIIAIESTNRGTVVTVLGYADSRDEQPAARPAESPADNQQVASRRPADNQQQTTNKILDQRREIQDTAHGRAGVPVTVNGSSSAYHCALKRLNEARLDVAGRLKIKARPIHLQDQATERALVPLIKGSPDFEADFDHVLQIRIAEAIRDRSVRWLSGSMFEPGAWRQALAMTGADVEPGDQIRAELAYAPVREEDDAPDFTYGMIGASK